MVSFVLKITNISRSAGKVSKRDDVLLLSDLALNGGSILAGGLGLRELDVESLDFTGQLQDLVLDLANVKLISYSQQHMSVLSMIGCEEKGCVPSAPEAASISGLNLSVSADSAASRMFWTASKVAESTVARSWPAKGSDGR